MHVLDSFLPTFVFTIFQYALPAETPLSFKEQCLKWHNDFRSIHQVSEVVWNEDLAQDAEDWARHLADNNLFDHATNLQQLQQGENLYWSSRETTEPCTDAIKAFYEEIKDYDFDNPGFSDKTGHFTQVVWKATTKIGAAGKTRADGSFIVVVRYSPPGNLVPENSFRENVLPSESWQPPTEAGVVQTSSNFVFIITGLLFSSVFQ